MRATKTHLLLLATRCARGLQVRSVLKTKEDAGKTGCTLHPRSRVQRCTKKCAHEHTGSAEAVRPSLRNGFTAYFVLSLVIGLSCHHRHTEILRDLTPASRRQDHTTSPYASARLRRASASFVHAHESA